MRARKGAEAPTPPGGGVPPPPPPAGDTELPGGPVRPGSSYAPSPFASEASWPHDNVLGAGTAVGATAAASSSQPSGSRPSSRLDGQPSEGSSRRVLALQGALYQRSVSAASERTPAVSSASRPTSAASQHSGLGASLSFHCRAPDGQRPSMAESTGAASEEGSHASRLESVISQVSGRRQHPPTPGRAARAPPLAPAALPKPVPPGCPAL